MSPDGLTLRRIVGRILFLIALPAIAKRRADTHGHKSNRRQQEDDHGLADGVLSGLGGRRSRAIAHGATLRERGHSPQPQKSREYEGPPSHLTPREITRNASGKKTIIMARQKINEHMVNHFMVEISNFMCMK